METMRIESFTVKGLKARTSNQKEMIPDAAQRAFDTDFESYDGPDKVAIYIGLKT